MSMSSLRCFLASCCFSISLSLLLDSEASEGLPSFSSFVAAHGRKYAADSQEYATRWTLYEQRIKQVHAHNSQSHRRWTAVVNHLSDRTEAELFQLRGLRSVRASGQSKHGRAPGVVSAHSSGGQFLSQIKKAVLPTEKSWVGLKTIQREVDQGACGSCWAIATSIMLDSNAEINGHNRTFSAQELVNCVPNPHKCGGTGGCQGATVELAMNWAVDSGLKTSAQTPYAGVDETCAVSRPALVENHYSGANLEKMTAIGFHPAAHMTAGSQIGLKGWERLPENQYQPLVQAVAETGPVAVSVAASGWQSYGSGIFDGCDKDAVIDHAVTLIGYGVDKECNTKYWTIKNSWGASWGEEYGTIRLLRQEGNEYCGTDSQPKVGTGCDGGPESVPVCGMCGILYDAVVPYFNKKK